MSKDTMDLMKKIIEDKKKRSGEQNSKGRPQKTIGSFRKAIKSNKQGGLFDK